MVTSLWTITTIKKYIQQQKSMKGRKVRCNVSFLTSSLWRFLAYFETPQSNNNSHSNTGRSVHRRRARFADRRCPPVFGIFTTQRHPHRSPESLRHEIVKYWIDDRAGVEEEDGEMVEPCMVKHKEPWRPGITEMWHQSNHMEWEPGGEETESDQSWKEIE